MLRLVQISNGSQRRVAVVQEPSLVCLEGISSVFELAFRCIRDNQPFAATVKSLSNGPSLPYDEVYNGTGEWHLLSPVDVPNAPERMLVAGTGLTHLGSAKDRQSMHLKTAEDAAKPLTDSMRMFEWGLAAGRPADGHIGIAPEWFYKGNGTVLKPPLAPLTVPAYAEDGGEEAELAGVYLIADDGSPVRLGFCQGNEFSDHKFEKRNYLNLAGSKLRSCSIGPELVVDGSFLDVKGAVSIERNGHTLWSKAIESGEANMAHNLANLEHHHFKFEGHRTPGHLHIHFFGAHSLSFGEGLELQNGDWMQVHFEGYGRPLRNPITIADKSTGTPVHVRALK